MTHTPDQPGSEAVLLGKLRCIGTLLQQLNAQTAATAINEAVEMIAALTRPGEAVIDSVIRDVLKNGTGIMRIDPAAIQAGSAPGEAQREVATVKDSLSVASGAGDAYQDRVGKWMDQCFPRALYGDMTQRCDRFLEESLELLQAMGYDRSRVATLVDYVWNRPVGHAPQEVGGTVVTLAALCWVAGIDMQAEALRELARIEQPEVMAKIRAKQEAKNALHFDSPLPGFATRPAAMSAAAGEGDGENG